MMRSHSTPRDLVLSLLAALVVIQAGTTALAEPVAPRPTPSSRIHSTLLQDPATMPSHSIRTVARAIDAALAGRQELAHTPLDELLEPSETGRQALKEAMSLAEEGQMHVANLEVDAAVQTLKKAVDLNESHYPLILLADDGTRRHAVLLADLAMAHFLNGDEEQSRTNLMHAFAVDSKLEFDSKRYPPQMKRLFDESRFLAYEMGKGNLEVATQPPGCEVQLDGKPIGTSPLTASDLTAGKHLIMVSKPGYSTRTVAQVVEGADKVDQVSVALKPLEPDMPGLLADAFREGRSARPKKALAGLARRLRQQVIVIIEAASRDDIVQVKLLAYDGRRRRMTGEVTGAISAVDSDRACQEMAGSLVTAILSQPTTGRRPVRPSEPWLTRWRRSPIFWAAVGVVASAAIAGVAVGIYYGTRREPDHGRTLLLLPAVTPGF